MNPGALLRVTLPAGIYTAEVNEGTTTLIASTRLDLYSQSVAMVFVLGEAHNPVNPRNKIGPERFLDLVCVGRQT